MSSVTALLKRKTILLGICVISSFFLVHYYSPDTVDYITDGAVVHLNQLKEKVINLTVGDDLLVEHLFKAKVKPHYNGSTIFFLETHLPNGENQNITLNARQACSVESAAKLHPDYSVFLIYFRPVGFYNITPIPIFDAMLSYPNVHVRYVDIYEYSSNTPLESWFEGGILLNSTALLTHTSDVMRTLTLWKYTGTYLDLDVIVRKRINTIGPNFSCAQKDGLINNAVSNYDSLLGRSVAGKIFEYTIRDFDPNGWSSNGPEMITKVLHEMCNNTDIHNMTREACQGFWVLPPEMCYEIDHTEHKLFFIEEESDRVIERIKDSFVVHFWNVLSGGKQNPTNVNSAYTRIAEESCPRVLAAAGDFL